MEQQPLQEELCNGDATSLVRAPCGDGFQTARVLTHPLRMLCDREGVFYAVYPLWSPVLHTRHDHVPGLPRRSRCLHVLDSPPADSLVSAR
jgi:hypothetical protein